MKPLIIRGDALNIPLADSSVDLIMTSPPYFGLRSYKDDGEHYDGQIGSEATPQEYLEALWACTAEWVRVLKPGGSVFVNLGDKYAGSGPGSATTNAPNFARHFKGGRTKNEGYRAADTSGMPTKSLMGLPWRYAIGCMDRLGLILRSEIIWDKPNGLPESVRDRVRRNHEQVFHFTKQPRYYSAIDEIREEHTMRPQSRPNGRPVDTTPRPVPRQAWSTTARSEPGPDGNPLGKLPGSVWRIPSSPLKVPDWVGIDHFAAYPPELVRRIVLGWSPPGVCTACGEGRRPVADRSRMLEPGRRKLGLGTTHAGTRIGPQTGGPDEASSLHHLNTYRITGYACGCPVPDAPARPAVVLDPFGGTGTTAMVASVLGRQGISVDASHDYCRLAQWRVNDPKQREKVLGKSSKSKPKQTDSQLDPLW